MEKTIADSKFKIQEKREHEAGKQASSADLLSKVRGFSALNARRHIEGKRNAIDAQSAKPFVVLPANPAYSLMLDHFR